MAWSPILSFMSLTLLLHAALLSTHKYKVPSQLRESELMPGRVSARGARIALVLFVTVQAIVWSHSRYASVGGVGIRGNRHGHASG